MKKSLFMMGAALLALASCTNEETVSIPSTRSITFGSPYVGITTKAATATETNLAALQAEDAGFYAFGGYQSVPEVFKNTHVTYAGGTWGYNPTSYWVIDENYKFLAYAPDMGVTPTYNWGTSTDANDATLTFTDVVVNNDQNQVDFIYDDSGEILSETNSPREKVPFTFEHKFSMVQFTIKSGFAEDVVVGISNFNFYGMNSRSTLTEGVWAQATEQISVGNAIQLKNENAQAAETPVDYVDNCVVMPQTFGDDIVYVEFTVTLTSTEENGGSLAGISDEDRIATIKAAIPADVWEPGFRYNYIVTIDGQNLDYITFDEPEVSKWEDYDNIDLENTL